MLEIQLDKLEKQFETNGEETEMLDMSKITETINKIISHCKEIDKLEDTVTNEYQLEQQSISRQSDNLKSQMQQQYDKFKNKHFVALKQKIETLETFIGKDYSEELAKIKTTPHNYNGMSFETIEEHLHTILDKLNAKIQQLNATDFDALVPPVSIEIQNEEFITYTADKSDAKRFDCNSPRVDKIVDPKPIRELVVETLQYCKKATLCIDALTMSHEQQFNIGAFNAYVQRNGKSWLDEVASKLKSKYNKRFDELFVDEKADAIPKSFFAQLEQEGHAFDVDILSGTSSYNEAITLGDVNLLVDNQSKHLSYFEKSPVLKKYLKNGYLVAPIIHNLKSCGNILLNINEDNYSDETKKLVNQIIIQFLLSFPANRINFCLIDADNKMDLSRYKSLTKINTGILFNDIIRDDRKIEDTVKDLEQTMYSILDTLSLNDAQDIYDYNERFEANQQNMHLLVLVNYPTGMREDIAKRISKIIEGGRKVGIFTLIINNKSCALPTGYKREEYNQFVQNTANNALVINKSGREFTLALSVKNIFEPKKEDYVSNLSSIVETLKENAESSRQKVIPLSQMFQETDRVAASPKGIPSYAEILEIPIGRRGGEIQTIELKTTGVGAVHSVVIGGTGSGKSNLLHTIIMNACYRYSPEELNLWLVDFKGGVEFKYYEANKDKSKQLPHVKLTSLTSELEDGVAVLNNLHNELKNREDEFRRNGVEDLVQYRNIGKTLPRLLVIIDEIQELFERDGNLGEKAVNILSEIFKKGRAFGINILWASQNIPNAVGLKEKILSQIGNRISLRLNNPSDAEKINIDPKAVKALNRPEKGLGIINDIRCRNDSVEFRVAYAETSENRLAYSQRIIDKWSDVVSRTVQEPLFIVGDDDDPSPVDGLTLYNEDIAKTAANSQKCVLQLGQNYITGKPFDITLPIYRENMNVVFVGYDIEMLRDMMGYSLLSLVRNNILNKIQYIGEPHIYCANGERITNENGNDLFNVLKSDFNDLIDNIFLHESFKACITNLYNLYLNRREESQHSEKQKNYSPQFVVIHSLQRFKDLLDENPMLTLSVQDETDSEKQKGSATNIAGGDGVALMRQAQNEFCDANSRTNSSSKGQPNAPHIINFSDALQTLLNGGGVYGIHFIISVDNPSGMLGIKKQLSDSMFKVFIKGVEANVMQQMLSDPLTVNTLNNPKVALIAHQNERNKIRVYRFEHSQDGVWYGSLRDKYNAFRRKK